MNMTRFHLWYFSVVVWSEEDKRREGTGFMSNTIIDGKKLLGS